MYRTIHHHQFLTPAIVGGDGYERMTFIVLGPLSSPLLSLMSIILILCPHLYCLAIVVLVCLCFFFLRTLHVGLVHCVEFMSIVIISIRPNHQSQDSLDDFV